MHSSFVVILLATAAASPAFAAPIHENEAHVRASVELDARKFDILSILKPLGTGLLGGAAIPILNKFLGGGDDASTARRGIDDLSVIYNYLQANPAAAAVLAQRDAEPLEARKSILGSLLGATEDSLSTVLKTSAAAGLASGAVAAAGGALEKLFGVGDQAASRRELSAFDEILAREVDERALNLSPIAKGIIGTITGLGAAALVDPAISGVEKLFGVGDSAASRRDLTPEQVLAGLILSSRSFNDLD
ncbi:hypothetical protein BV25DRAFT_1838613 [Artomyces pyxidatus]|uniref:Uncharacterized protein n=1 Tax=Artomyces pyxidatus TaxID=48021 RepID=A0ACB8T225_9AGAM|nr:hypothetical protein BV25DRAFT_1838613 [Artomyces pyxidatus]